MVGLDDVFNDDLDLDDDDNHIIDNTTHDDDDSFEFLELAQPAAENDSILVELLKTKGINDSKIKIIDEYNEEKEVDFFSLSKEEQLEILSSQESNTDLNESEAKFLAELRKQNLTVEDYLRQYTEQITSQLNKNTEPIYEIDAYDDHELFLLDLKSKFDLTDEELSQELEKELQNEELFKKKVTKLRTEYKTLEDEYNQELEAQNNLERQEKYNQFVDTMVDVAVNTPEFYGIELEDNEKNDVLGFLLDVDESGTSEFYKAINDPKKLYEAAWFIKYGKEAFDTLKNAYESEITKLKDNKRVVVKTNNTTNKQNSIHDLF